MAVKKFDDNPTITDTIQIDLQTTDANGQPISPYRLDQVTIYYIERSFEAGQYKTYTEKIGNTELIVHYTDIVPVRVYGNEQFPAWLSTDQSNAFVEPVPFDEDGNAQIGVFRATWEPKLAREGDYMVCWKWTPLPASPKQSAHASFYVHGDLQATTVIPSHVSPPDKYEELLNLYTPEMFKLGIAYKDVTPSVIARMNAAVGKGFGTLENLSNQILDLIDANATHEALLPYLANLFKQRLWSNDPTLWRRQIKQAVRLNKQKGTMGALQEALSSAGFALQKLTKYWQVVSQATWTECFEVGDGQVSFKLSKLALLPPNATNFKVSLRAPDDTSYTPLTLDYVSFANTNGETTMVWLGNNLGSGSIKLITGDRLLVTYQVAPVVNQTIENYIRALPLADQRDETLVEYPKKNWNVKLIAEDDPLFNTIVPTRHPFAPPVVFGQIRTEFGYSENIYNMEEYNGSLRNSNLPCDIDKTFVDSCSACQSSSISLDIEMEDISDDRLKEAGEIVKSFVPFHSQVHSITFSGAVNEYIPPPVEDIDILVQMSIDDHIVVTEGGDFNRLIPVLGSTTGEKLRGDLSTATTMATGTATGFNSDVVLYSPNVRFDLLGLFSSNLLEILSGLNVGTYQVTDPGRSVVGIVQSSPDSTPFPLDTSAFTFRLSNLIWTDSAASVYQDDLFVFSDANVDFTVYDVMTSDNSAAPWKVVVSSGPYAGTYPVKDILPNNTLVVMGWGGTSNVSGLNYTLKTNSGATVLNGTAGAVSVTRRGRIVTQELQSWGINGGGDYYAKYAGTQYQIVGFADSGITQPYILGYTGGNAASVSVTFMKRLLDNKTGYVDVRGMYILTTPDYEAALDIQNGSNPPTTPVESSSFKESYLVKIGSEYYGITAWDANRIDVEGPKKTWGLTGTSLSFSLINYMNNSPVFVGDVEFPNGIDRRGGESITTTTTTSSLPLALRLAALNSSDGIAETVSAVESISFTIEHRDGSIQNGEIK